MVVIFPKQGPKKFQNGIKQQSIYLEKIWWILFEGTFSLENGCNCHFEIDMS